MSRRNQKRQLIKDLSVEKFSDMVKRKLKQKHESSRDLRSNKTK